MQLLLYLSFFFVERDARYKKWKMAVERSLGWVTGKMSDQMTGKCKTIKQSKFEISGVIQIASLNTLYCLFDTETILYVMSF